MHLVDHAIIKGVGRIESQKTVGPAEFLNRRDHKLAREVARRSGNIRHARGRNRLPQRGLCLGQDLGPMGDHKHPRRPAESLPVGHNVKCREPGFPKARGHGDESLGIPLGPNRGQGNEGFCLPGAGK